MESKLSFGRKLAAVVVFALIVSGCSRVYQDHRGIYVDDQLVDQAPNGIDYYELVDRAFERDQASIAKLAGLLFDSELVTFEHGANLLTIVDSVSDTIFYEAVIRFAAQHRTTAYESLLFAIDRLSVDVNRDPILSDSLYRRHAHLLRMLGVQR